MAAAALRLLMLTGCRRNEILTLRWEDVRLQTQELHLTDSKTARAPSRSRPRRRRFWPNCRASRQPLGDPRAKPGARLSSLFEPWRRVRARASLDDVRIHDLRHSYASRALALGESLPVIAKLLGHAQVQTTARYTHLTRDAVKDAAIRVARDIAEDVLEGHAPDRALRVAGTRWSDAHWCRAHRAGRCFGAMRCAAHKVKEAIRASAARIAADIGADILPPRQRRGSKAISLRRPGPKPTQPSYAA